MWKYYQTSPQKCVTKVTYAPEIDIEVSAQQPGKRARWRGAHPTGSYGSNFLIFASS